MRSDIQRIGDILTAMSRIEDVYALGIDEFETSKMMQESLILNFQILGEAANGVSDELQALHPEVAWADMVGFRNVLIHRYWEIVLNKVWDGAEIFIPEQKPLIEAVMAQLGLSDKGNPADGEE
ncbi:MAG: HepT-like ribonuclease domain-containing protein [Cyanobacteria bacterium J06632_3]